MPSRQGTKPPPQRGIALSRDAKDYCYPYPAYITGVVTSDDVHQLLIAGNL